MSAPRVESVDLGPLGGWRVRHGDAELLVARQGAQVLSYRRGEAPPLIWLSEDAGFVRGQSVRGGVPVCWPWFGDLARNPEAIQAMRRGHRPAPAHGEVRNLDWQLLGSTSDDEATTLEFTFAPPPEGLPDWPHHVDLTLRLRLDERLTLSLESRNRDEHPVALSQALHTYFAVGDIHRCRVLGLEDRLYLDCLEGWSERRQQGPVTFTGETDRVYLDTPQRIAIEDQAWGRRILVESRGSSSAVVWNPWIDKARRLSQFADDAWQRMLCVETANVMTDHRELAPGDSCRLELSLDSEAL